MKAKVAGSGIDFGQWLVVRGCETCGSGTVFDLDDPYIWVEGPALVQELVNLLLGGREWQLFNPAAFPLFIVGGSRGGAKEMEGAIQMINDYVNGTCLFGTFADYSAIAAMGRSAAQEGANPDFSFEARQAQLA